MIDASGVTVARQTWEDLTAGRQRITTTARAPATIEMLVNHAKSSFESCGPRPVYPASITTMLTGISVYHLGCEA